MLAAALVAVACACTPGGKRGSDNRTDQLCERLLRKSDKAEAREWLRSAARSIGGRSSTESIALVEELYALGATEVVAVDIGTGQTTDTLVVVLPEDAAARKKLFELEEALMKTAGFDKSSDQGQKYLFLFKLKGAPAREPH